MYRSSGHSPGSGRRDSTEESPTAPVVSRHPAAAVTPTAAALASTERLVRVSKEDRTVVSASSSGPRVGGGQFENSVQTGMPMVS
jgi:hypothetical protein